MVSHVSGIKQLRVPTSVSCLYTSATYLWLSQNLSHPPWEPKGPLKNLIWWWQEKGNFSFLIIVLPFVGIYYFQGIEKAQKKTAKVQDKNDDEDDVYECDWWMPFLLSSDLPTTDSPGLGPPIVQSSIYIKWQQKLLDITERGPIPSKSKRDHHHHHDRHRRQELGNRFF